MMQPDAPTPSQVADVSDVSASRTAGYAAHPLPLAPGIRQDHTQSFLSFRKSHLEKRKNDMPSRLDWLLSIIGGGDAEQLLYFVEANKQLCETTQPGETCAHCSARVTNNSRSRADDYQPANRCTICQRWHCEKHCNFVVTLSFATRVVKLPCCEKCYRTVDVLRWHQDQLPDCLSETSRQIMFSYVELSEQLTTLAAAVSQLDGASRSLEQLQLSGPDSELFKEVSSSAVEACKEAIQQSRRNAVVSEAAVSAHLKQLEELRCTGSGKDSRLRQNLMRQSASQLQALKLRLKSAGTRADQLMRSRRFSLSLGWAS